MIVGTGIDIVDIPRLRTILGRQGERFTARVFTPGEREYCLAYRDPAPHFAARFAAKEALMKALRTGWGKGVSWQDAEVVRARPDAPVLALHGGAAALAASLGASAVHLSLTHAQGWAAATVILERA